MKRNSYSLNEEKRTLIHEETYNENGNVVHSIDYQDSPHTIRNFTYNEKGQLIHQNEYFGDIESSAQSFEYDDEGTIIDEKLYIGGTLYEHTFLTTTETGFVRRMIQDGVEVERLEKQIDGKNWSNKFYANNELQESQEYTFDKKSNTGETFIKSHDYDFESVIKDTYDSNGYIILSEEYHGNGSLLSSTETFIENDKVIKETVRNFSPSENYYDRIFEYDRKGNLINFEVRLSKGTLDSFHKRKFDSKNRLIEEAGYSNGHFSGITGIHGSHSRFHFVHEYE